MLSDILSVAIRQISRNKLRSQIAVVGITLAIFGVITVATMGEAIKRAIVFDLELVGRAVLLHARWDYDRLVRWHQGQFTGHDFVNLEKLPGVDSVAPFVASYGYPVNFGDYKIICRVLGVEKSFFRTLDVSISNGRSIESHDEENSRKVCVLGLGVLEELFGLDVSPIGKTVSIKGQAFPVVGVLGGVEYEDLFYCVLIPLSVARTLDHNLTEIRDAYIRASNLEAASNIKSEIADTLKMNHPGYENAIEVLNFPDRIKILENSIIMVEVLLLAALMGVLILAELGVMSLMFASVKERTVEIGIRRAVGATENSILLQFLAESCLLSFVGGIQGILLGAASVAMLTYTISIEWSWSRFLISCFVSLGLAIGLGILAGILPAKYASQMSVVDAIQYE